MRVRSGTSFSPLPTFCPNHTPTQAAAGSSRSEPWRRTHNPLAQSAKAHPPQSLPASTGPFPRKPLKDINIVCSDPFCVNRWDRPQCDSSGAVSGRSEPWRRTHDPLAQSAKAPPPQSLLSEQRPNTAEPTKNRSGAVSGRSEPWRRTPQPPRAKRESLSFPEPTQRAEA